MSTWTIDNAHTQVNFSAKHMMVTTVRGTFHDVQGTIELYEADPTRSRGDFTIKTASIDTNFGARDTHLRSAEFFDAEAFPEITFRSTSVEIAWRRSLQGHGRPDDPRPHEARDIRCRARGDRARHARRSPRRSDRDGHDRPRRLGPDLERRPGAGWLARRQGDQARCRRRRR
ncbi:MAG: YceI family protein [Candidatus Limnocylindrales bacterium]